MGRSVNEKYLSNLVEEAAELIQAAMKAERFGPDNKYPSGQHRGRTNIEALAYEVGNFLAVYLRMDLPEEWIQRGIRAKDGRMDSKWGPEFFEEGSKLTVWLTKYEFNLYSVLKDETDFISGPNLAYKAGFTSLGSFKVKTTRLRAKLRKCGMDIISASNGRGYKLVRDKNIVQDTRRANRDC